MTSRRSSESFASAAYCLTDTTPMWYNLSCTSGSICSRSKRKRRSLVAAACAATFSASERTIVGAAAMATGRGGGNNTQRFGSTSPSKLSH